MSWQEVAWPELGCDHRQVKDRAGLRRGWRGGEREGTSAVSGLGSRVAGGGRRGSRYGREKM